MEMIFTRANVGNKVDFKGTDKSFVFAAVSWRD